VASDPASMALYRIDTDGSILPLPDGRFVSPWALAVEPSGAVLVADRTTQKLRRVARDGTVTDLAVVHAPRALLVDDRGGIVVLTDRSLLRVTGGQVEPVLQDRPFAQALDVARLPDGGYAVTDGYARTIWRVTPEGRVSPLVAGGALRCPQGIALAPDGELLVADPRARAIFRVSMAGKIRTLAR
jgi:sugar lactone lactonase YvrE